MTENKARKAAIRVRMAETGEPYSEAARRPDDQTATADTAASPFGTALQQFGIPPDVLVLVLRHCAETDRYPLLGADAADRLKISLDLKDWVAWAKARLGRPQFPQDARAYEALRSATVAGEVIVPLTAATYMEVARISSLRQRTDLANVIAEISGFVAIASRSVVMEHQLLTALAAQFGGRPPAPIPVFGLGNPFGVGEQKAFVLRRKGGGSPDLPTELVREIETAGRVMAHVDHHRVRLVLVHGREETSSRLGHRYHVEPFGPQEERQPLTQQGVVLDDHNPHGTLTISVVGPPAGSPARKFRRAPRPEHGYHRCPSRFLRPLPHDRCP
ncbi:hypothetical protein SAMN04489729_6924 [Amycolatopsis lurida]|nr:hypothetical protein SAMN04489729_6924 [Amycolatopsis lurida]